MPYRLIRDGILESESVLSLPVEARWLYVSILLSADDVGLFEATPFRLARRADIRREHAERMVQLLADCDLIRLYRDDGKAFGFIPKYGQRLQIKRARCPLPPLALLEGDSDAINKINYLASKPTVENGAPRKTTVAQPLEPEPEPEGKSKPKNTNTARVRAAPPALVSVSDIVSDGVDPQHAADWMAVRKLKKLPLTPTAWADTKAEAIKAGMTIGDAIKAAASNGWGGFKAAWIENSSHATRQAPGNDRKSRQLETAALMTGARRATEVFDVECRTVPPLELG